MPTTVQAYPHRRSNYVRNLVRLGAIPELLKVGCRTFFLLRTGCNWGRVCSTVLCVTAATWHLYGHPWEIEKLNLWSEVKEMLDYVSQRESVTYANNGGIAESHQSAARR